MKTPEQRDFNQAALTWDASPTRMQLAADVGAALLARITPQAGMHVLDFGCGTGLLSLPWAARVARLTGADSAQGMLDIFADKAMRHGLAHVDTLHFDLDSDAALPCRYDLIVSSMTLHHVRDTAGLFRKLFAALNPGGQVALADLEPDDGLFHADNTGVFHFGFERSALQELLRQAGFEDIETGRAAEITRDTVRCERTFGIFLVTARRPAQSAA